MFHSRLPRARKTRGAKNVGHMLIFLERFADTSEKDIYDFWTRRYLRSN